MTGRPGQRPLLPIHRKPLRKHERHGHKVRFDLDLARAARLDPQATQAKSATDDEVAGPCDAAETVENSESVKNWRENA